MNERIEDERAAEVSAEDERKAGAEQARRALVERLGKAQAVPIAAPLMLSMSSAALAY
ncbi:hypothetical protein [Prosthecomicrobium pneumaticum]|uniref:Uncharacterized protein n=1 Tax=Prosthecomicrobium pneumaticum TaxID=81895 RepID=A0A7W9L420_9HYPH|nr:hypothetical protein [Prosthecomicrobium pneumaticum]MBB5755152.1 hypothetical protein [Prosthecomicrobium pneumaticum]